MSLLDKERAEILAKIHALGYDSLRYSVFSDSSLQEWETRIEYDGEKQVYLVYATMDRASYNKKLEVTNFEEAKEKFLEKLHLTVEINRNSIQNGLLPDYPSPVWDDMKD
ncbi:Imm59 family immunity protein [Streptococcus sp. H31]|uniref:Imm59 family immunity protein n=1 Tax=Streptococcus huangxiaojuni TaxID=3237239 RepID=UPI0034A0EEF6